MREHRAYLIPAAIITGLAIHELIGAFCLLLAIKAKRSPAWIGALVVFVLCCIAVLLNFLILDFAASPFPASGGYMGNLMASAYFVNFTSSIAIVALFLTRIRMFFGNNSSFYRLMLVLGIWVVLVKGAGDFNGARVSRAVATGEIRNPTQHIDYQWTPMVMAFASAFEAIFSAVSSFSFLYYLSDFSSAKTGAYRDFLQKVPMRKTLRACFIILTHFWIAIMGTWVVFDNNYISHTGFYMVALVFCLEIHFFLDLSYQTSKAILGQIKETVNESRQSVQFSIKTLI